MHATIKAAETERSQIQAAHAARDVVVSMLSTVTRSVQEKASQISELQQEKSRLQDALTSLQAKSDMNKLHPVAPSLRLAQTEKPLAISTTASQVRGTHALLTVS